MIEAKYYKEEYPGLDHVMISDKESSFKQNWRLFAVPLGEVDKLIKDLEYAREISLYQQDRRQEPGHEGGRCEKCHRLLF